MESHSVGKPLAEVATAELKPPVKLEPCPTLRKITGWLEKLDDRLQRFDQKLDGYISGLHLLHPGNADLLNGPTKARTGAMDLSHIHLDKLHKTPPLAPPAPCASEPPGDALKLPPDLPEPTAPTPSTTDDAHGNESTALPSHDGHFERLPSHDAWKSTKSTVSAKSGDHRLAAFRKKNVGSFLRHHGCASRDFEEFIPHDETQLEDLGGDVISSNPSSGRLSVHFFGHEREKGWVERMDSNLDLFVGFAVVLNSLSLAVSFQWEGYKNGVELGVVDEGDGWTGAEDILVFIEHMFCIIFAIEFCLRLKLQGLDYLKKVGNVFDASLVVLSILDLYVFGMIGNSVNVNLTILRFARVLKLMRMLRIGRVMRMFSSLRVLVKTVASSMLSLFWSMTLLWILMSMASLFLVQVLQEPILDDEFYPEELRLWLYQFYGTSARGLYTMFEVTMSGCWPNYARRLIDEVSHYFAVFWVIYISLVVFAVIRIISAIFLKETLSEATNDADMLITDNIKKKAAYKEKLMDAFNSIPTDMDGKLSREMFDKTLRNPKIQAYFAVMDLEVFEVDTFFDLLDDGDGRVALEEFLQGAMRLKGQARTMDLMHVLQVIETLKDRIDGMYGRDVELPITRVFSAANGFGTESIPPPTTNLALYPSTFQ